MRDNQTLKERVLDMDAVELLKAYQDGVLKPSQAVEFYIEHQESFKEPLNLAAEDRYDEARREAAGYDARLEKGDTKGKLFGIPISMKEAFDVKGMNTTGGLAHLKDRKRAEDAEAIKRLRAEGAIILDKTNTPSLCFCQETNNNLFGRSNNPWDPTCTTGGSSGGEAGLIAVGGAAAGFGSDIGGSIRIPAHFNGVVGFKPGAHRYPVQGHFPVITIKSQKPLLGFGPIVKSVRDAALIYSIIEPSIQPPNSQELPDDLTVHSFGSFRSNIFHKTRCTRDTKEVLKKAQKALKETGEMVQLNTDVPQFMKRVALHWQLIMSEDGADSIRKLAYPEMAKGGLSDHLKIIFDCSKSWLGSKIRNRWLERKAQNHWYISWGIVGARLFKPNEKKKKKTNEFVQDNLKELETLLGSNGVFLIPTYPSPTKKHKKIYWSIFSICKKFRRSLPFICLANTFGLPAIVVPCGRSKKGLPIGLQVVSTIGNEALIFRVAAFLESRFGGYQRNSTYD